MTEHRVWVRFDPSTNTWRATCDACEWTAGRRSRVGIDEAAEEHEEES